VPKLRNRYVASKELYINLAFLLSKCSIMYESDSLRTTDTEIHDEEVKQIFMRLKLMLTYSIIPCILQGEVLENSLNILKLFGCRKTYVVD